MTRHQAQDPPPTSGKGAILTPKPHGNKKEKAMLRELNINEMNAVSGGTSGEDEVTVTATINRDGTSTTNFQAVRDALDGPGYIIPSPYQIAPPIPSYIPGCGNVSSSSGDNWQDCNGELPSYPEAPEPAPATTQSEPLTEPQYFEIDGEPHWSL